MSISITHPIAILNIVELVLSIIISGLISEVSLVCMVTYPMKEQFVSGIVYGYLIIHIILVAAIFLSQTLDKNLRLLISVPGSILYLTAAALMLEGGDTICTAKWSGEYYDRIISAGVLGLASCITMAAESYFIWRHSPE